MRRRKNLSRGPFLNNCGRCKSIILNGRYVSVQREGQGKQLLFLHGYMSDKNSFYYQIKFFSAHGFECIAPDFPGFGSSAPIKEEWSVGDYAAWLYDFTQAAHILSPHIIAHSFGCRVALKLLSAQNIADRLVITGGAGIVKPRSPAYMRKVKAYRTVKKFAPKFAEKHFGSSEYRALPPVMRGSYKKIVNEDLRACASLVKNKTLLIYGAGDRVTPPDEEGQTFHELIAESSLVTMRGDHFCFCRYPQIFNAAALAFLTED